MAWREPVNRWVLVLALLGTALGAGPLLSGGKGGSGVPSDENFGLLKKDLATLYDVEVGLWDGLYKYGKDKVPAEAMSNGNYHCQGAGGTLVWLPRLEEVPALESMYPTLYRSLKKVLEKLRTHFTNGVSVATPGLFADTLSTFGMTTVEEKYRSIARKDAYPLSKEAYDTAIALKREVGKDLKAWSKLKGKPFPPPSVADPKRNWLPKGYYWDKIFPRDKFPECY